MHRYKFLLYRPLQLLPVLFGISVITFAIIRAIPGDPARVLLGTRSTPEAIARIHAEYGLDQPLIIQYGYFVKNILSGKLGNSIIYKMDTLQLLVERLEPTLFFIVGSVIISVAIAIPLAAIAAKHQGKTADFSIRIFSTAGLGLPPFWLGIMLIILFSITFRIFPVSGYGEELTEKLHHLFLPCLTAALSLSAVLIRNLRAGFIREAKADYVTAALARGQSQHRIFFNHILPNTLVPIIHLLAVNISWLIGGTVVIESVFGLPGIGQLLVKAIFSRDYTVVQGVVLLFALATVFINLVADILTVMIDSRIKL